MTVRLKRHQSSQAKTCLARGLRSALTPFNHPLAVTPTTASSVKVFHAAADYPVINCTLVDIMTNFLSNLVCVVDGLQDCDCPKCARN